MYWKLGNLWIHRPPHTQSAVAPSFLWWKIKMISCSFDSYLHMFEWTHLNHDLFMPIMSIQFILNYSMKHHEIIIEVMRDSSSDWTTSLLGVVLLHPALVYALYSIYEMTMWYMSGIASPTIPPLGAQDRWWMFENHKLLNIISSDWLIEQSLLSCQYSIVYMTCPCYIRIFGRDTWGPLNLSCKSNMSAWPVPGHEASLSKKCLTKLGLKGWPFLGMISIFALYHVRHLKINQKIGLSAWPLVG